MITRYAMSWGKDKDDYIYVSPTESTNGNWVSFDDYAALHYERIHDLNQIGGLQEENARLKAEVERLDHQVRYWRIEAEVDNARWLRCLEDLEKLRKDSQP